MGIKSHKTPWKNDGGVDAEKKLQEYRTLKNLTATPENWEKGSSYILGFS